MKKFLLLLSLLLLSILAVNCGGGDGGGDGDGLSNVATELIYAEDGGELVLESGATLSISANSLPDDTTITFREITNEETPNAKVFVFEPEGLMFNEPAILKFPAEVLESSETVEAIILSSSIAGIDDGEEYVLAEGLSLILNDEGFYEAEINHFSSVTVYGTEVVNVVFQLPSKYLLPGDIEYTLSSGNRWRTGHGRMFLGFGDELGLNIAHGGIQSSWNENIYHLTTSEREDVLERLDLVTAEDFSATDTFIEASLYESGLEGLAVRASGVYITDWVGYRDGRVSNLYLGAKRVPSLTWSERINIAKYAIDKDGASYNWIGNNELFGYSCVGLIESSYDSINEPLLPWWSNVNFNTITPVTQYHSLLLEDITEITVIEGERVTIPVYGILRQDQIELDDPYEEVDVAVGATTENTDLFNAFTSENILDWVAESKPDGQPWQITFTAVGEYDGIEYSKSKTLTINVIASNEMIDGLVARYPLDGNSVDSFGTYDGVNINGVSYEEGIVGQAASFDGVDDYIDLPETVINATSGSVSLWFNCRSLPSEYGYIFSSANSASPAGTRRYIYMQAAELVRGMFMSTVLADVNVNHGEWYHAVLTWDTEESSFYLNGTLMGTGPGGAPTPLKVNLGSYGEGMNSHFDGLIDEVKIYNKVLSQAEITVLSSL